MRNSIIDIYNNCVRDIYKEIDVPYPDNKFYDTNLIIIQFTMVRMGTAIQGPIEAEIERAVWNQWTR